MDSFLLISAGSCRACWVENWGELAQVPVVKTRAEKMASVCFQLFARSSHREK